MTIKQWIYKHVNVTFLVLFLLVCFFWFMTLTSLDNNQWGYAVLYFFFTLVTTSSCVNWWRDRL